MMKKAFIMISIRIFIVLMITVLRVNGTNVKLQESPEYRLKKDLFSGYDPSVRPTAEPNKPIFVQLQLALGRIASLDEKNEELTVFMWLGCNWKDHFLQWNPFNYNKTFRLIMGKGDPWLPEINLYNGVEQGNDLAYDAKFRVAAYPDGTVVWAPGFKLQTSCSVQLRNFPFDTQTCHIIFTNWMYSSSGVNFTVPSTDAVSVTNYQENGVWQLINWTGYARDVDYSGTGLHSFPQAVFSLTLKRKPLFHVINVMLPCVIVSFIAGMVFSVPPASGEKISLGISIVLSYSVLLLLLSDVMPRSSDGMPLITMFITITMSLNTFSLVMAVTVLWIFHHSPHTPVPKCVKIFIIDFLGSILCFRKPNKVHPEKQPIINKSTRPMKVENMENEAKKSALLPNSVVLPAKVDELVDLILEEKKEGERMEKNKEEWETVALIIDRFCLIIYYTVLFTSGAALFGIMAGEG